jgi:hypothetical protein
MFADDMLLDRAEVRQVDGRLVLTLGCRLNWYRALPVSCVEHLSVTVDGVGVPAEAVSVRVAGVAVAANRLVEHDDDWWPAAHVAELECDLGARSVPDPVPVCLEIGTRVPYLGPLRDGGWRLVRDECSRLMAL